MLMLSIPLPTSGRRSANCTSPGRDCKARWRQSTGGFSFSFSAANNIYSSYSICSPIIGGHRIPGLSRISALRGVPAALTMCGSLGRNLFASYRVGAPFAKFQTNRNWKGRLERLGIGELSNRYLGVHEYTMYTLKTLY